MEDRVRALESEVRELKDLLDEKDEKIDMLSRIHSFSSPSRKDSSSLSPRASTDVKAELKPPREEYVQVERSTSGDAGTHSPSCAPSTTGAFIGTL